MKIQSQWVVTPGKQTNKHVEADIVRGSNKLVACVSSLLVRLDTGEERMSGKRSIHICSIQFNNNNKNKPRFEDCKTVESHIVSFWAVTLFILIGRQNTEVSQEYSSSDGGMTCLLDINGVR